MKFRRSWPHFRKTPTSWPFLKIQKTRKIFKSAGRFGFDTAESEYFQVLIRRYSFAVIAPNEDDFQKEREIRRTTFRGANFSGNKRLGQLSSSADRLSLSENVSPSAEKGPRKCRVCSIRIHWHSSGPCCWRRQDLVKILLRSRRWNAFGLTIAADRIYFHKY